MSGDGVAHFIGGHCTACGLQANRCECDETPGGRVAQLKRNLAESVARAKALTKQSDEPEEASDGA